MNTVTEDCPLWSPSPSRKRNASVTGFIEKLNRSQKLSLSDIHSLYDWSIEAPSTFWSEAWDFLGIIGNKGSPALSASSGDFLNAAWFPAASLNFAENLLKPSLNRTALVFHGEDKVRTVLTREDLAREVLKLQRFLLTQGVKAGDVIAGLLPNSPLAVIGMLAASSLGALWTSCSPDFGVSGIVDRFGQTAPKILITADGYYYKGAIFPLAEKISAVAAAIPSIKHSIVDRYTGAPFSITAPSTFADALPAPPNDARLYFEQLPFCHPLYIMYSSGTTGKPKCIVHSAGGTLLEHLKEHVLHVDLKSSDIILYQTTCGWMMWNWLVSALAVGATVALYDGYPLLNGGRVLFDIIDKERVTVFGTNAKFIATLEKEGLRPSATHSLETLHTILSTGSPLLPENFDYVYASIKKELCLSSISGGTDIIGCFALGSPTLPVYRGELQTRSLGLNVQVWDEKGESVTGARGELVCTAPFPSQPICFWNDPGKERYRAAYFSRFQGVWCHGDYVELTPHKGMIFFGRSDAVLNPGGIRIGTAEIYRQVEKLPEIEESIAVGQDFHGDVRVILFVKLHGGAELSDELKEKIKTTIRANASPFHVPKVILGVPDIPKTRSGKITELAVRDIVNGKSVKNTDALVNPESLSYFKDRPELR